MKVFVVLCALVGSALLEQLPPGSSIQQCQPGPNKSECPPMAVTQILEKYEIRQYRDSKWVGTSDGDDSFYNLFGYIQGENEQSTTMPMTAPVITKVCEESTLFCTEAETMFFYIGAEFADNAPAPTSEEVFLADLPATTLYVRAFDGYANGDAIDTNRAALVADLQATGQSFRSDVWLYAGYDSPYDPIRRRNEIWIIAQ